MATDKSSPIRGLQEAIAASNPRPEQRHPAGLRQTVEADLRNGISVPAIAKQRKLSVTTVRIWADAYKRREARGHSGPRPNWFRRLLLGDPDKLRRWLG